MGFSLAYRSVPLEVAAVAPTGIFDFNYTHVSSDTAHMGIQETRKIMAPRLALAHGVVGFSGEMGPAALYTYMLRSYYVSVSTYPHSMDSHHWRRYLSYGMRPWTPEVSQQVIAELKDKIVKLAAEPYGLRDFEDPLRRMSLRAKMEGCIELEEERQKKYAALTAEERAKIGHPQPDIYTFGLSLESLFTPFVLGARILQHHHPFLPAEIHLGRHLRGMFTRGDVVGTKAWISNLLGRDIPVASIDALATWEDQLGIVHR